MEKQDMFKLMGIVIVVIMGFSMFAVLTSSLTSNNNTTTVDPLADLPSNNQTTTFNYTFSFPATTLKDLSAIRFAAITTELDKQKIDSALLALPTISKVTSTFSKSSAGTTDAWVYRADIALAKGASAQAVADQVKALSFFSQEAGATQSMKLMTVSAPKSVLLHNADLNIDRNYSFSSTTLSSLVNMDTLPSDALVVDGTISLLGSTPTALQLQEAQNLTNAPKSYTLKESLPILTLGQQVSIQATSDKNNIDTNALKASLASVDANAQVYVSAASVQNPTTLAYILSEHPTTTPALLAVLSKASFTSQTMQSATFHATTITIPDVNTTFDFNNTIPGTIAYGHAVGDTISLTLTAKLQRGKLISVTAEEKK